jgi:hypothetical protein
MFQTYSSSLTARTERGTTRQANILTTGQIPPITVRGVIKVQGHDPKYLDTLDSTE